jgi:murein DD-endopeptidase MepM/ murein hydrolase activator NlpD
VIVIVAAASASAAGFAGEPKPRTAVASFTASPTADVQSAELSANRNDTNAALSEARRVGVQRASALTHRQEAAAAALVKARKEAAAALVRARVAAAKRVARDKARKGLLARAQSDPKAVARMLAADRGWGGQQYQCLSSLWTKESGWRWNADNPSSDAYGIPQALPGSKMSSSGSDWATNPATQIKWGLGYIAGRYGTPCSAWAHSQAVNWY